MAEEALSTVLCLAASDVLLAKRTQKGAQTSRSCLMSNRMHI